MKLNYFATLLALGATVSANSCPSVQYNFPAGTNSDPSRAEAVKAGYVRSWNKYAKYCFGDDEFAPISHNCIQDLSGWGATIVDGIDTAIIMNLTDIVSRQLAWIYQVDFSKPETGGAVSGFDAVIRYLGGLLSSHDLLTGGFVPKGTYNQTHVDALLKQATVLANKLKTEFGTPSGLPAPTIYFNNNTFVNSQYTSPLDNKTYNSTNTAICGTIVLEFHRLSDLTGDNSYRQLADKAESYLINPKPKPFHPALVGSQVDTTSGKFLNYAYGWQGGIDSFYEYLIKDYYYNPAPATAVAEKNFWVTTVGSTIQYIALHPYHRPDLTYISQGDDFGALEYVMDDYACFSGGNFLLGGKLLNRPDIYQLGIAVTDSCHHLYNTTVTGLGPLGWGWYNASNLNYYSEYNTNQDDRTYASKNGYFITAPEYEAFPETIESIFYAYRITGDNRFQQYNWQIWQSLNALMNFTDTSINNVNQQGNYIDYLPSFHFAEVSKYLYLSFTDPNVINLNNWVFNTEAHPFLRNDASCGHKQQPWSNLS